MAKAADVLKIVKDSGAEVVDLRFCDLPGLMQHFSIPAHELTEEGFEDGYGFDGSSIRGFQEIQESDMLLVPDAGTAYMDPFTQIPTLALHCFVKDPVTGEMYTRDPRGIARKAELYLKDVGIQVEVHHHEVGTAGQAEIDIRYDTLLTTADNVLKYKYVVKNTARRAGKTVTFMPKPIFMDNGSGMHTHQSLWNGSENLFWDELGYAQISDVCRWYIGGLLAHAPALLAFCAPTTNSYRRLVPGYEAPINLVYSQRNRSACARIPVYFKTPAAKRLEFRCPDPSANPYLCFAAQLMAGLDGIQNKIDPGEPIDKDLYDLEPEEAKHVKSTPGSRSYR